MRNKIIMIAAMLAVMVAMTGIAAALTLDITPMSITLAPNQDKDQTAVLTLDLPADKVTGLSIWGKTINGVPTSFDPQIYFTINIDGTPTNVDSNVYFQTHSYLLNVKNDAAAVIGNDYEVEYTFSYIDSQGIPVTKTKTITVGVDIIPIPEFPTIALPIAAVIGLVFLFQNKKKKD